MAVLAQGLGCKQQRCDLTSSCPCERKGKALSISRGAKCLRLPLILPEEPDAQLICSDPPQNTASFTLYMRGGLLELAKATWRTMLSMHRRTYQLFSRFVTFAHHLRAPVTSQPSQNPFPSPSRGSWQAIES